MTRRERLERKTVLLASSNSLFCPLAASGIADALDRSIFSDDDNAVALEVIKQREERVSKAEATPNGVTLEQCQGGYVRVTFAEKPARSVLDALRAAGFFWGNGSWAGKAEQLPSCVNEQLNQHTHDYILDPDDIRRCKVCRAAAL